MDGVLCRQFVDLVAGDEPEVIDVLMEIGEGEFDGRGVVAE